MVRTLSLFLLVCMVKHIYSRGMAQGVKQIEELEQELHRALLAANEHQNNNGINKDTMEEPKSQKSDSKNFGLINTIVNHNNQLKKINLIVTNFPEAKQVKESIEKAKELEKHLLGPPQPHRSWRELVLVILMALALVIGTWSLWLFGKK